MPEPGSLTPYNRLNLLALLVEFPAQWNREIFGRNGEFENGNREFSCEAEKPLRAARNLWCASLRRGRKRSRSRAGVTRPRVDALVEAFMPLLEMFVVHG